MNRVLLSKEKWKQAAVRIVSGSAYSLPPNVLLLHCHERTLVRLYVYNVRELGATPHETENRIFVQHNTP